MTIIIRRERPADIADIRALHITCFPTDAEARLVDALRDHDRLLISLVACDDKHDASPPTVIGHVAISPVMTETAERGAGLAPIAVLPSHRQRGIAARLVQTALDECRAIGLGWAVVLGDPHYYQRFGFTPASNRGLHDEYQGGDAFQAIELRPGRLPVNAGLIRYAPEFTLQ